MEQKKTLWIIAASGVFLLVVIGAALLLNSPSAGTPSTASITTIDKTPVIAKTDEPAISPVETPSSQQTPDANTLAFEKMEGGDNAIPADTISSAEKAGQNTIVSDEVAKAPETNATTEIQLKTKSSVSENVTATSRAGAEAIANAGNKTAASTIYTAAPGTSAAAKTGNTTSSKTSETKKTVAAASAKPKAPALSSKYWVQAASFTNKKSADNARSALDDNKIPAEVFTYKDAKDTMFYRVRVGPYTTKSEAEYWKTRICKIDLFKDTKSYVTEIKM